VAPPPRRVRLRRTRGWRKPPGAVVVARPSRWGNPYVIGAEHDGRRLTREETVELFREALLGGRLDVDLTAVRAALRGRDLACWCPLDVPCHADVLLEVANQP
jgi:uncharacterized protein DUF4326